MRPPHDQSHEDNQADEEGPEPADELGQTDEPDRGGGHKSLETGALLGIEGGVIFIKPLVTGHAQSELLGEPTPEA
jgi:hypothetical protein